MYVDSEYAMKALRMSVYSLTMTSVLGCIDTRKTCVGLLSASKRAEIRVWFVT